MARCQTSGAVPSAGGELARRGSRRAPFGVNSSNIVSPCAPIGPTGLPFKEMDNPPAFPTRTITDPDASNVLLSAADSVPE